MVEFGRNFPRGKKSKRTKDFSLLESQKPGFEVFFGIKFFIFYYKPFLYKIKEKKRERRRNTLKFLFITYDVLINLKGSSYPIFLIGPNLPADLPALTSSSSVVLC